MLSPLSQSLMPLSASLRRNYLAMILGDAPLGYWRLGEASGTVAADETGNHPGTYSATGVTLAQSSLIDDANPSALFDGSAGNVTIDSSAAWNFGTADFSVEFWFQTGSILTSSLVAVGRYNGSGGNFWCGMSSSKMQMSFPSINATNAATVNDGHPHHFVGSRLSGTATCYIDGVAGTPISAGAQNVTTGGNLRIARFGDFSGGGFFFPGTLDEVAVYSYGLSAAQVAAHYAKGKNG